MLWHFDELSEFARSDHGAFNATSDRGQTLPSSLGAARPLPPSADIGPGERSVGQAAQFCLVV